MLAWIKYTEIIIHNSFLKDFEQNTPSSFHVKQPINTFLLNEKCYGNSHCESKIKLITRNMKFWMKSNMFNLRNTKSWWHDSHDNHEFMIFKQPFSFSGQILYLLAYTTYPLVFSTISCECFSFRMATNGRCGANNEDIIYGLNHKPLSLSLKKKAFKNWNSIYRIFCIGLFFKLFQTAHNH